ncbi:MAG: preprotein translocase subunit SecA [Erysipelotrichaceae bacterium]|nr:preprotein translocase subunit SecA [Erysipelotrichaceae bacterium]
MSFIEKLFRFDQRALKKIKKESDQVIAYESQMAALTDDELKAKTPYFKEKLANGATLDDIKYEAFAVAREAAKRVLGQFPFPVQIQGALVLNQGDVAEMRTGEGKTLTATMAVYLNALEGKGVHVVTVNEYLAARDADWMGQIYRWLGLTVGINLREKTTSEKREAYNCDITYTTNSELGFDYLRDNMAQSVDGRVLRGLNFCVVDEADSILIDESRTPLIISGGSKTQSSAYKSADWFVKMLKRDRDFVVDIKDKTINLTDHGNELAQRQFGIPNLYDPQYQELVHRIYQALKANYIFTKNVEYMVDQDGEIQLIDQFTGRILKGREYSDGLQQAIQAKENVKIKEETVTMATITYQNFFRLYKKCAGMTGTAKTEEEEFRKIYNMRVVVIPTNKPIQRVDAVDMIFGTKDAKFKALVEEVKKRHEKGQPILIGTVSVEMSEYISGLLDKANLPHEVLNAKNHAREAAIIEHAGEKGAITIATNMAGRGTDIKINDEVKALGGLCVFGTERHESRRIDNQLRGRSGRQGDPGYSCFYVSFEDDLMMRFVPENFRKYFLKLGDEAIQMPMASKMITDAQTRIEGQNFDTRKSLLDYDDVMRQQREIMYKKRDKVLFTDEIHEMIQEFFMTAGKAIAKKAVPEGAKDDLIDGDKLYKMVVPQLLPEDAFKASAFNESPADEAGEDIAYLLMKRYKLRRDEWGEDLANHIEKQVALHCIDRSWTTHIDALARLRDGIHLRSYANVNPLQDYVNEGFAMFNEMLDTIALDVVTNLLNLRVQTKPVEEPNTSTTSEDNKGE